EDGLPNNYVQGIAQTSDGHLWITTSAGLARFDGTHFTEVSYFGTGTKKQGNVRMTATSGSGGLWICPYRGPIVGLDSGLSLFSLPTNSLPNLTPTSMVEDGSGTLWIEYANRLIYQIKNGQVAQLGEKEGVPASGLGALIRDAESNIWLIQNNFFCIFRNGKFQQLTTVGNGRTHATAAHPNGL